MTTPKKFSDYATEMPVATAKEKLGVFSALESQMGAAAGTPAFVARRAELEQQAAGTTTAAAAPTESDADREKRETREREVARDATLAQLDTEMKQTKRELDAFVAGARAGRGSP